MNLGPHATFILASYGSAIAVVGALIGWIWTDHRAQRRRLARLQAQGATRRSEQAP